MADKKILRAGVTWACIWKLIRGETETIELDADTELVISRTPEPGSKVGIRGRGTYVFPDDAG